MSDYLIVRRDGLVPAWPCFVLDGYHPAALTSMKKFAIASRHLGLPGNEQLIGIARRMHSIQGQSPPPILEDRPMILEAMSHPGCYVQLYELSRGHR